MEKVWTTRKRFRALEEARRPWARGSRRYWETLHLPALALGARNFWAQRCCWPSCPFPCPCYLCLFPRVVPSSFLHLKPCFTYLYFGIVTMQKTFYSCRKQNASSSSSHSCNRMSSKCQPWLSIASFFFQCQIQGDPTHCPYKERNSFFKHLIQE